MHLWNLKLDLGNQSFDEEAFGPEVSQVDLPPIQQSLWQALDPIGEDNLHVTTRRVGKVLRVDVRIEIPA